MATETLRAVVVDAQQQATHFAAIHQIHLLVGAHLAQTLVEGRHGLPGPPLPHKWLISSSWALAGTLKFTRWGDLILVTLVNLHDALVGILGSVQIIGAAVHVQRKIGRRHADQHQHHQTDAFLAIVGTVCEAHPMAEQISVTRAQNGGCFLPSTSRRSSGVLWILLPSHTRFMANSSKAGNDEAHGGRDDEREHDVDGFADVDTLFQRLMADQGMGAAYPRMEPIRVWELDAGMPKYQVPRFQTMAENSRENTMIRPWVESMPKQQIDGQQVNDGIGHPNPPSMTPAKLNRPEATTAI